MFIHKLQNLDDAASENSSEKLKISMENGYLLQTQQTVNVVTSLIKNNRFVLVHLDVVKKK